MTTVRGVKSRITVPSGTRAQWLSAGPHTVTDIGTGSALGAGLGWTMSRGALLRFTMAAGHMLAADGAGARDLSMSVRSMDRLSSASSAEDISDSGSVLAVALEAESGGSRLASGNRTILGITPTNATSRTRTSPITASPTS